MARKEINADSKTYNRSTRGFYEEKKEEITRIENDMDKNPGRYEDKNLRERLHQLRADLDTLSDAAEDEARVIKADVKRGIDNIKERMRAET